MILVFLILQWQIYKTVEINHLLLVLVSMVSWLPNGLNPKGFADIKYFRIIPLWFVSKRKLLTAIKKEGNVIYSC